MPCLDLNCFLQLPLAKKINEIYKQICALVSELLCEKTHEIFVGPADKATPDRTVYWSLSVPTGTEVIVSVGAGNSDITGPFYISGIGPVAITEASGPYILSYSYCA